MPTKRHVRIPILGKAAPPIGSDFVSLEAASGIVLLLGAGAALVWVNSDTGGYTSFWHHQLTVGPGELAIVDDIGAIVVIALFYSRGLDGWWLLGALLVTLVVVAMSRLGVDHPLAYVVPGVVLWWCLHEAGVEPTLAGVVLGLLTPA